MSFEKTKASQDNHTPEQEVEEKSDLNNEEESSSGAGQPDNTSHQQEGGNNPSGEEKKTTPDNQDVDYWKRRAEIAERDKENYQQGLLSRKVKERTLKGLSEEPTFKDPPPSESHNEEDNDDEEEITEKPSTQSHNTEEQHVLSVIYKQNEKKAISSVLNPKSDSFIPELVDDINYHQILTYLPRNIDRSDEKSIIKSLRIATKNWKEDMGIKDEQSQNNQHKSASADIASIRGTSGGSGQPNSKSKGPRILKKSTTMRQWYSK